MQKLILQCDLSLGDIVMLTAAVRDLHRCYPGRFQTDVRTPFPELWEHNPYLTPLSEADRQVRILPCRYPLINRCNTTPYHCLHGFIEFLNERLGLAIRPTRFKGDIHLCPQEKHWYSQVHELAGRALPFWIIDAGGKYDLTTKWWEASRYQEVVNRLLGRIQFVQVGSYGHYHPRLENVIDLRGETTIRELVRLVYHAQGVLCPITSLMHLAAAVETVPGCPPNRPCVVVAGGREPVHWEAYPDHQFIHTTGALPCCCNGGCWKDRHVRLRDGDWRDRDRSLCQNLVQGLPRCLDMITPQEVCRRIELYFQPGHLEFLKPRHQAAARRAIQATRDNSFDDQPLTLSSAGLAFDAAVRELPTQPPRAYAGRGIIMCGGGSYLPGAWVTIRLLRRFGCFLPIELWHLGPREITPAQSALLARHGVRCIDGRALRKKHPVRILNGWELKAYALLYSAWREVLFLDADNVPVRNPEYLFDTDAFRQTGAVFWPDFTLGREPAAQGIWRSCGTRHPREHEIESGQMVLDKQRCWRGLQLALWLNEHSDFYYQHLHGDKETFHIAFCKLKLPYRQVPVPARTLEATILQYDFEGQRLFQHRNNDKFNLYGNNLRIPKFWFEKECRRYLAQLRRALAKAGGLRQYKIRPRAGR